MLAYQTYDLSTVILLVVLMVASVVDFRCHKIPNWLTFPALILGLALQTIFLGWIGGSNALLGAATGLAVLLPIYLLGGMGAGDVKLMAAVGTFVGWETTVLSAAYGVCLAGLYGILLVTVKREWMASIQRYAVSIQMKSYVSPDASSVTRKRFPFAVCIAVGVATALYRVGDLDFYHLTSELSYQWQLLGSGE
ncbi:A24 family peptidase [Pontibacterium granulatum]|uniref:A24 family peptidase n=1 Tax=Pontibacterium granulatum TaxID=2036029 RepID=UPI00249AED43|nr:A24 family peptidase [Pontibacterium granulatum]MDI3323805.1 A24 family peptidase [Pontibacterium granulatum]